MSNEITLRAELKVNYNDVVFWALESIKQNSHASRLFTLVDSLTRTGYKFRYSNKDYGAEIGKDRKTISRYVVALDAIGITEREDYAGKGRTLKTNNAVYTAYCIIYKYKGVLGERLGKFFEKAKKMPQVIIRWYKLYKNLKIGPIQADEATKKTSGASKSRQQFFKELSEDTNFILNNDAMMEIFESDSKNIGKNKPQYLKDFFEKYRSGNVTIPEPMLRDACIAEIRSHVKEFGKTTAPETFYEDITEHYISCPADYRRNIGNLKKLMRKWVKNQKEKVANASSGSAFDEVMGKNSKFENEKTLPAWKIFAESYKYEKYIQVNDDAKYEIKNRSLDFSNGKMDLNDFVRRFFGELQLKFVN